MAQLDDRLREWWRRAAYVAARFRTDHCSENAAALTYKTLFALVPLMTVLYTMATAVPTFQGLEERFQALLFQHLMPQSSLEIEAYLNDFSQQAKSLTGPGIAFLVVTAVLMLRNVETAFNQIWRTREHRNAVSSFLLYWAVLTLGPVTIGLALGLGTYLTSFASTLEELRLPGIHSLLLRAAPLLLSAAGFSLLYAAVPNCRVPFRHALVGGVVAAVAFNLARAVFTDLVVGSSITFIYGAFAAVPLFLLWLYISWNIVLMGGIVTHSLSAYQSSEQAGRPLLLKALDVLHLFWQRQQSGQPVRERDLLRGGPTTAVRLDSDSWGVLREKLLEHRVLSQTDKGHYMLSRDLHTVSLWQLQDWLGGTHAPDAAQTDAGPPWQQAAGDLLRQQRQHQREVLHTSLADLFAA